MTARRRAAPEGAPTADAPITKAQIRAVHAAARARGLTDDEYRDRLEAEAGVRTCKALSRRQAAAFLDGLAGRKRAAPRRGRRPPPAPAGTVRMITPAQRRLIDELASEIEWRAPGGYRRWLRSSLGLERPATSSDGAKVIEGLLAMRRRGR